MDEPTTAPPPPLITLNDDELALLFAHRARRQAALDPAPDRAQGRPPVDAPPPYRRRAAAGTPRGSGLATALTLILTLIVIAVFSMLAASFFGWTPPQLLAPPTATGAEVTAGRDTAVVPWEETASGQVDAPPPALAPSAAPLTYDLVVPDGVRGAWTREGTADLQVAGLAYAILGTEQGVQYVELDNGQQSRVWLHAVPAAPVRAPAAADPAIQVLVDAADMGVPSTHGTGGSSWAATPTMPAPPPPTAQPPLPRPTAPLTFDPAHAGPGGSSGGSTWGQP